MKRFVIVFLIFSVAIGSILSEPQKLDSDGFQIKAFKIGEEDYLKIVITDAINEYLETNPKTIDIGAHMEKLARDTASIINFKDQVIFSFRVAGNRAGTYEIEISFEALKNQDTSNPEKISTFYTLTNYNIASRISNFNYAWFDNGVKLADKTIPTDKSVLLSDINSKESVSAKWEITTDNAEWITRGAVAMAVSSNDYEKVDYGTFKAPVTVTLEVL